MSMWGFKMVGWRRFKREEEGKSQPQIKGKTKEKGDENDIIMIMIRVIRIICLQIKKTK